MSVPTRNPLRSRIEGSEQLLGGWCTLPTSFAAELVASSGVDYAVIDLQHGLTGYSDLVSMLQAITNCVDIDTDNTTEGRGNMAMSVGDED